MNTNIIFLNSKQVAEALRCSLPTARRIMRRPDFPLVRCGKNMRVEKQAFKNWASCRHI